MNHAAGVLPTLEALDPRELKALIVEQHKQILIHHEQLLSRDAEIEHLKLLLANDRVVATPHLGASTEEAQVGVATDVAEQVIAVLRGGFPRAAVNAPLILPGTLSTAGH